MPRPVAGPAPWDCRGHCYRTEADISQYRKKKHQLLECHLLYFYILCALSKVPDVPWMFHWIWSLFAKRADSWEYMNVVCCQFNGSRRHLLIADDTGYEMRCTACYICEQWRAENLVQTRTFAHDPHTSRPLGSRRFECYHQLHYTKHYYYCYPVMENVTTILQQSKNRAGNHTMESFITFPQFYSPSHFFNWTTRDQG